MVNNFQPTSPIMVSTEYIPFFISNCTCLQQLCVFINKKEKKRKKKHLASMYMYALQGKQY